MIDFKKFNSVISLTSYFTSDEKCKQAIIQSRWSDGDVVCPYCGGHHCVVRKDGKFRCKACRRNFSCLVGTILIDGFEQFSLMNLLMVCETTLSIILFILTNFIIINISIIEKRSTFCQK